MTKKKSTGTYYTPDFLADFIFARLKKQLSLYEKFSILEPSVGKGSFLSALSRTSICNNKQIMIQAIDINKKEINRLKKTKHSKISISYLHKDFLRFKQSSEEKYNLIVGNPPYIKKNLLSANQIKMGNKIYKQAGISEKLFKNIWSAFLVKSITLLDDDGILAFILPSELLQVKYAIKLKDIIQKIFKRIEIYTFSDLLFECKGQNTIILIGYKKHLRKGVYYSHISDINDIDTNHISLRKNDIIQSLDIKWIHHTLCPDDLLLLDNIKNNLKNVKDYCSSKPGIVTAANDFFIVNSEIEKKYDLSKYTKSIIQKGSYIQTGIVFNYSDYEELSSLGKPIKLICLNNSDMEYLNAKNKDYLLIGEKNKIQDRYKCQLRSHWAIIPNVAVPPEGFFFKRNHLFPKLVKNEAEVLVTDSAYKIEMDDNYDINSFIFSFYNSFTFVFSELGGRYYGGGVLELTPNEFKELPLPYLNVTNTTFKNLSLKFKNCNDIKDILNYTDFILLSNIGLNKEKILRVQHIRDILTKKRHKKTSSNF